MQTYTYRERERETERDETSVINIVWHIYTTQMGLKYKSRNFPNITFHCDFIITYFAQQKIAIYKQNLYITFWLQCPSHVPEHTIFTTNPFTFILPLDVISAWIIFTGEISVKRKIKN